MIRHSAWAWLAIIWCPLGRWPITTNHQRRDRQHETPNPSYADLPSKPTNQQLPHRCLYSGSFFILLFSTWNIGGRCTTVHKTRERRENEIDRRNPREVPLLSYPGKHEIKTKSSKQQPRKKKLTGLWEAAAFFYTRNTSSPSIYILRIVCLLLTSLIWWTQTSDDDNR